MAAGDAPAERTTLADEVVLADELGEGPRPHPGCERLALRRRLEQGLRPGATGAGDRRSTGRHAADGTAEVDLQGEQVEAVHEDLQDGQDPEQEAADEDDPADVPLDVAVLVGRPGRQWHRGVDNAARRVGAGPPAALAGRARLGRGLLLGEDRRLQLRGASE